MPEIGEVARTVHFIQKHLVGKTLSVVKAQHDENVFGKVGCSAAEFEKALTGKMVVGAKRQGKYFWLEMSSPPHPLLHFGMTGWFKIRDLETFYYKESKAAKDAEWPPKYWKFSLETKESPKVEAAFVDSRRFARCRLIDCPAEEMRNTTPLKENGPDPVIDKDIFTEEWLSEKVLSKKIPIKALMLDQANMSGLGNWVGDEVLYDAKIHPEQYSNTLSTAQISQLHKSIHYVCGLAVELLADSSKFPEEWLFKHRWGKGKKDSSNVLPNGAKIKHITVGGRTSAIVPSVQKKTGKVAGDVKDDDNDDEDEGAEDSLDGEEKPRASATKTKASKKAEKPAGKSRKRAASLSPLTGEDSEAEAKADPTPEPKRAPRAARSAKATPSKANGTKPAPKSTEKTPASKVEDAEPLAGANKRRKTVKKEELEEKEDDQALNGLDVDMDAKGRRRSGRLSRR